MSPLAAWLTLTASAALFLPLRLELALSLLGTATLATLLSGLTTSPRSLLFQLAFALPTAGAYLIPLPIPPDLSPLPRLAITFGLWSLLVLVLLLAATWWQRPAQHAGETEEKQRKEQAKATLPNDPQRPLLPGNREAI